MLFFNKIKIENTFSLSNNFLVLNALMTHSYIIYLIFPVLFIFDDLIVWVHKPREKISNKYVSED